MPRRKSIQIQSVVYHDKGALITIFVPGAGPDSIPADLLGGTGPTGARRGRRGGINKAAAVLQAIKGGASKPTEIVRASGVPNKQVHSYIAYHKKRGNIKGDSKKGFTAVA